MSRRRLAEFMALPLALGGFHDGPFSPFPVRREPRWWEPRQTPEQKERALARAEEKRARRRQRRLRNHYRDLTARGWTWSVEATVSVHGHHPRISFPRLRG